jgi:hypothetical protein
MKYILTILTFCLYLGALAQDYTFKEKTTPGGKYYDVVYTEEHAAFLAQLKHVRDSVIKKHPGWADSMRNWKDSMVKYADTIGNKRVNRARFILYHDKREAYRDIIQTVWLPICDRLRLYNRLNHVVGDLMDQRLNKIEQ